MIDGRYTRRIQTKEGDRAHRYPSQAEERESMLSKT